MVWSRSKVSVCRFVKCLKIIAIIWRALCVCVGSQRWNWSMARWVRCGVWKVRSFWHFSHAALVQGVLNKARVWRNVFPKSPIWISQIVQFYFNYCWVDPLEFDCIKTVTQQNGKSWIARNKQKHKKAHHPPPACLHRATTQSYLYFQSNLLLCKYNDRIGTSVISVSCPPASSNRIFQLLISDSRLASTEPADPPPTIMKSYSASTCFTLKGRFSGSKRS